MPCKLVWRPSCMPGLRQGAQGGGDGGREGVPGVGGVAWVLLASGSESSPLLPKPLLGMAGAPASPPGFYLGFSLQVLRSRDSHWALLLTLQRDRLSVSGPVFPLRLSEMRLPSLVL